MFFVREREGERDVYSFRKLRSFRRLFKILNFYLLPFPRYAYIVQIKIYILAQKTFLFFSGKQFFRVLNNFFNDFMFSFKIYNWLMRLNTARGSCTGLITIGPSKVKACKSVFFTEGRKVPLKSK